MAQTMDSKKRRLLKLDVLDGDEEGCPSFTSILLRNGTLTEGSTDLIASGGFMSVGFSDRQTDRQCGATGH
jgi:hypothetical protein